MNIAVLVALVIIVILAMAHLMRENFSTRREKANSIFEWFNTTQAPTYNDYKRAISNSDIVEYEKVRGKYNRGATRQDIENLL